MKKQKNYYKAVAVFVGYIIGVGMFSLPYLVVKVGLLGFFIWLAILVPTQHMVHSIYANMILVTKRYHRMPGYAGIYLGKKGKLIVFIAKMTGNIGGLLAYIIITGIFLNQLLSPIFGGSEYLYASVFFLIEAIIVYFGIGMIARMEVVMIGLLIITVALITFKGSGAIELGNFSVFDWKYFLLPYGIMLFALDGNGALPIMAKLLKRNKKAFRSAIRAGYAIAIAIIVIFTIATVGISGQATTQDALVGLDRTLGNGVVIFALVFGVLTMATSVFGVAESVRETLCWDFKLNHKLSWAIAVLGPYALYAAGIRNLSEVVSFAGAVAGGLSAIIMVVIYTKLKKMKNKLVFFKYTPENHIVYLLIAMFISGIIYEIYYFFLR